LKHVVVLGASIVYAWNLNLKYRLSNYIEKNFQNVKCYNASVPGASTADGIHQITPFLGREEKITHVVSTLGLADFLYNIPIKRTQHNLVMLLDLIEKDIEPDIFVQFKPKAFQLNYVQSVNPSYKEELDQALDSLHHFKFLKLCPFILEGVAGNPQLTQGDGIHPNERGMQQVLSNAMKCLREILN
jgi:acyl-CoA thioesterase-1